MKFFYLCAVVGLTALVAVKVSAEQTATNEVTLAALIADAMAHNPELNFYRAEIAAAKGDRKTATAWQNPEGEFSLGGKRARDNAGLSGEGVAWSVSVSQTFDYPARMALRKAIANRQIELADNGLSQFQASLAAKVRSLGYHLLIAQEKADASQEVAQRGQELVDSLVQRESAGVAPLLEKRIIEANVISLKRKANEATKDAQNALFEINQLRGEPLNAPLKIAKTPLKFSPLPDADELLACARTNNFELRQRRIELEQQGFKVELSKKDRLPSFKVAPFYSEEKALDKEQTIGVGVSVPLPLWNRNTGNIETAKARHAQAETSFQLAQRQVERELREQTLTYQIEQNELTRLRPNAIEQLREAAELGDRHYRLGSLPIATYVELQKQYLEGLEAILDTQADALESLQQIELLVGRTIESLSRKGDGK